MRAFLMWLSGRLPARIIAHQGQPYLERYYVGTPFGLRVYLHRFVDSDPDGLHDHPWRWSLSVILFGWYFEQRRGADVYFIRRWFNWITGDTFHRVVLPSTTEWHGTSRYRECWSLFIHSPRCKGWGFLREVDGAPCARSLLIYNPAGAPPTTRFTDWYKTAPKGRDIERQP